MWIPDDKSDVDSTLLFDQLAISSAIEEVEVNTCRFGDGTAYDSGILQSETRRSDLLSSTMSVLLLFIFSWMALETMLKLLPLPDVPKKLKNRSSLIDRCIYYLMVLLPGTYDETLLPGYEATLEELRKAVLTVPLCSKDVGKFDLQSNMNRWGLGIDRVRKVRNELVHGVLSMLDCAEPDREEAESNKLFELGARIIFLTMQLVLYLQSRQRNVLLSNSLGVHKESECAAEAVRTLHLNSSCDFSK